MPSMKASISASENWHGERRLGKRLARKRLHGRMAKARYEICMAEDHELGLLRVGEYLPCFFFMKTREEKNLLMFND